jgi:predicted ester cyclase
VTRDRKGAITVTKTDLSDLYRRYIACLNAQDWSKLGTFVATDVSHNGRQIGLSGYRAMLEKDFREIPDLRFNIELLIADAPFVASRLAFDCSPTGQFLGLAINGRPVSFAENVFYEFQDRARLVGPRQGGHRSSALRSAWLSARHRRQRGVMSAALPPRPGSVRTRNGPRSRPGT